jgi:hypothetical protein
LANRAGWARERADEKLTAPVEMEFSARSGENYNVLVPFAALHIPFDFDIMFNGMKMVQGSRQDLGLLRTLANSAELETNSPDSR